MTDLTAALRTLDRLTDPVPQALAGTRETLDELRTTVAKLNIAGKGATADQLDSLWYLAWELNDTFDVLADEIEKRYP